MDEALPNLHKYRDGWCDGWGSVRLHSARSRDYCIADADEQPDTIWLCDTCAAQMCATHHLEGQIIKNVTIYHYGKYIEVARRPRGIWKEYRL